jgi:ornithine cyclodeaminase/alanine dehydrogenase-like protein (mu-crystallin family)
MDRAVCIVADMPQEVLHDTGDAIAAISAGVYVADKLVALADLVAGRITPRRNESDIVLYKSVGSALQDVVIAQALYERAKQQGLGIELPASIVPVSK